MYNQAVHQNNRQLSIPLVSLARSYLRVRPNLVFLGLSRSPWISLRVFPRSLSLSLSISLSLGPICSISPPCNDM